MDEEKSFDKISFPIMIKVLSTLEIEGNFFTLIKNICQNPLFNIIFNGETKNVFLLSSEET